MNNNFNYALNQKDYTWKNALLWGNFSGHFKKIGEGKLGDRIVHAVIALLELLPIIGQAASIAEKLIVANNGTTQTIPPSLTERNITTASGNQQNFDSVQSIIQPQTSPQINRRPPQISITTQLNSFRSIPGCKIFSENEEQVEIALLGQRVNHDTKLSPWKLHISANPENAGQVLEAIKPVLIEHKPHFKFIKNEELLDEYNSFINPAFPERGRFKEGKFITIYAKEEKEILTLARAFDAALKQSLDQGLIDINLPKLAVCRTDRPVGRSGLLWARHDQAGSPITDVDFNEGTHAAAAEGNYNVTTYFPINWAFDYESKEMERRIQSKFNGVKEVAHKDIFEAEWGVAKWNSSTQSFRA